MHSCHAYSSILAPLHNDDHSTSRTKKPSPIRGCRRRGGRERRSFAVARSSLSPIADLDLYDLLGVHSCSDGSEIKKAYRELQKRCHPDIAGPAGHDMAIVLNQAYSLLSDPSSRSAYDKEHAKISELCGFTGKPLYSMWLGSESEHRAVFVDEVSCVGCLKCAFFAGNTFAIESAYGRARVVRQWADPEHHILDAIRACPVDCISFVERSDLPALEFLMSKLPRGRVCMTISGSTAGVQAPDVFAEMERFNSKIQKKRNDLNNSKKTGGGSEHYRSTVQRIKSTVGWLRYRKSPIPAREHIRLLPASGEGRKEALESKIDKLREAAAKMGLSGGRDFGNRRGLLLEEEEYWTPTITLAAPPSRPVDGEVVQVQEVLRVEEDLQVEMEEEEEESLGMRSVPVVMGLGSAMAVGWRGDHELGIGVEGHVAGKMALEVVNSFELQVVLAGVTWYLLAAAAVGLLKGIRRGDGFGKKIKPQ